jgi:hypothetical protein
LDSVFDISSESSVTAASLAGDAPANSPVFPPFAPVRLDDDCTIPITQLSLNLPCVSLKIITKHPGCNFKMILVWRTILSVAAEIPMRNWTVNLTPAYCLGFF